MLPQNKETPKEKEKLHPRNKHRERYNFPELIASCAELARYVKPNPYKDLSIDFFDPQAVKVLNKALLKHFYSIEYWDIPGQYLCPPIPGRADYIHYVADLLAEGNNSKIPEGNTIACLDIGTGANCIYPIIGNREYGWRFIASDIDAQALSNASKIISANPGLGEQVELRQQHNPIEIFRGIIQKEDRFDITICNPPFHSSFAEAQAGTIRKLSNLKRKKIKSPSLNFGGKSNELWCPGGEVGFVQNMIRESKEFAHQCKWFSTLISKSANLNSTYYYLNQVVAKEIKTINMGQGNKISRIVAWRF
jgi:23S rRNA (adenine1618-N6)-methyltransferase